MSDRDDPRKLEQWLSRGFGWLDAIARPETPRPAEATCPFGHHAGQHFTVKGDGDQWKFKFDNGYGASVVRHEFSYGFEAGLWELAVVGADGRLTYDTPITDDVLGWLSESEVADLLDAIEALPRVAGAP